MKPFCINEKCVNFLPEDKRGYKRKSKQDTTADEAAKTAETAKAAEKTAAKSAAKTAKKPATKARQEARCQGKAEGGAGEEKTGVSMETIKVIGAGLAGCEAAWQLARRGIPVALHEMKPRAMTPAHHSPDFAELVCSNSLRGDQLENAVGLLKEELRRGRVPDPGAVPTRRRVEAGGCPGSGPLRLFRAGDGEDPQSPESSPLWRPAK